jgi:glycosyltransferase involved in cell wall biosynthesis/aminoglycoside phosphotransferase (APT) family kinase protein
VKARRAVAVVVSRFPLVTETFILREIEEMERQGLPVVLVPLLREKPAVVHREAEPWIARALYAPFLSPAVAGANLRALRQKPGRYLGLLARVLLGTARSPNFLARTLALFPKSVYLAERLREEGVVHVHAHFATHPTLVAYVVARLTGIPYSFTVHAHDLFVRSTFLEAKVRSARFVRAISRFNLEALERLCPGAGGKTEVIHAGVDPSRYDASTVAAAAPPRLLCVAALKPYKGLPVLIEACRLLREQGLRFRCDLVGDGPLRGDLERAIAARDLAGLVHLLGARRQDEVARLMAEAAVVVLPSVVAPDGQMEGIPVALMEAMSARRPVVASRLSGIPELVDDGRNGLLVPPEDPGALASAVRRLLEDPGLARRLGIGGREKVLAAFRLQDCVAALVARIDAASEPLSPALLVPLAAATTHASAVGVRRVHERPESTVAELLVSDGRTLEERVLKLQRARPALESARREFETMSFLYERFGAGTGYGVPRPLSLDAPGAALVMERCRGRPLHELVRGARWTRSPARRRILLSAVERAGRWLRLFQQHTARGASVSEPAPAEAALQALRSRARRDLEALSANGLSRRSALAAAARLDRFDATTLPPHVVGHHGDFWPGNIYVDDESVQVIDFEGYHEALPYEDAAYFLVQLRPFVTYPSMGGLRSKLEAAFLEGYLDGERLDAAMWTACRTAKALHVLAQSSREHDRGLRRWWRRRTLRAMALEAKA